MRKFLFTLCIGATVMSASAEVTTFVAQGAPMCRYQGPADAKIVEMPSGFCGRMQSQTSQRGLKFNEGGFMEKTINSDFVDLSEYWFNTTNGHEKDLTLVPCNHIMCGSYRWYWARAIGITPAAGQTVTSIKMKLNDPKYYFPISIVSGTKTELIREEDFVYNEADSTVSWTGSRNEKFYICQMGTNYDMKTGTSRVIYFEITTTGTSTQVAIPQHKIKHSIIGKNQMVELSCPTPGAQIYYTIDKECMWGSQGKYVPTTESTLYTGPFSLDADAVVRAYAVKDGMTPSFVVYKEYYVVPEYTFMSEFNFSDYTTLKDENGKQIADYKTYPVINSAELAAGATVEKVSFVKTPAVDKDVTFTGTITNEKDGTGCDLTLSNTFGGVVELRPLSGSKMIVSVPFDKYIAAVYMEASVCNNIAKTNDVIGSYRTGMINGCHKIWSSDGSKDAYEVSFDVNAGSQYVDHLYVFYGNYDGSGVAEIEADPNAPVEYFNLQGIRVANPSKGQIYIKRQGNKATKVAF